jgi:uncharacterized protein DUF932
MLASRFKHCHTVRSTSPLSDDQMHPVVPSIYADNAHISRSDRYTYIPTNVVLDALRKEGFQPFMATQARVRDDSRQGYAKHMIRMRHASQVETEETVNEIVLLNSHDGSSSYQMLAGCFRFVCQNGMVCGDTYHDIRIQHRGNVVGNVIEGAYAVLDNFDRVTASKTEMSAIQLSREEQQAFAKAALPLRFTDDEPKPREEAVIQRRRSADAGNDLWTTFNVVQENLLKGGLPRITRQGKMARTRSINGIDGNVRLNKALWTLAEAMKALKA